MDSFAQKGIGDKVCHFFRGKRVLLMPFSFMDVSFQYNNPSNPADAAIGHQAYDTHLYYSYV